MITNIHKTFINYTNSPLHNGKVYQWWVATKLFLLITTIHETFMNYTIFHCTIGKFTTGGWPLKWFTNIHKTSINYRNSALPTQSF